MAKAEPTTVHRPADARPSTLRDLAQKRADDVVLAAARFKPNAVGSHELTTSAGFGQRQMLQARGAWLGERVVIAVTPLHVHALAVYLGGRASKTIARWPRADVRSELVAPKCKAVDTSWPAVLLTHRSGRELAEIQVFQQDDDAWNVLTLLLRHSATPRTRDARPDNCDH